MPTLHELEQASLKRRQEQLDREREGLAERLRQTEARVVAHRASEAEGRASIHAASEASKAATAENARAAEELVLTEKLRAGWLATGGTETAFEKEKPALLVEARRQMTIARAVGGETPQIDLSDWMRRQGVKHE